MSIQVTKSPEGLDANERCCFCRKSTAYWYTLKDVACCQRCALFSQPEDVPLKSTWCVREEIAMRGAGEMLPTSGRRGSC